MDAPSIRRHSLPDQVARALVDYLRSEGFQPGDKIPTTRLLCERFQVGYPTLREAIQQLETLGVVRVRHGSGIFVQSLAERLIVANPMEPRLNEKTLFDLIEARRAIEPVAAARAAEHADEADLEAMRQALDEAKRQLHHEVTLGLTRANMTFHRLIAKGSKNVVFGQLMEVLTDLFTNEQEAILKIYNARERDHEEHREIYAAIAARDAKKAEAKMAEHLDGVARALRTRFPADPHRPAHPDAGVQP